MGPAVEFDSARMLGAFQTYKSTPKFRRCCFLAMAWHLPSKETAQLQQEFFAIDKDQRGTISLAQLREIMVNQLRVPDSDVIDIFKAMDANHDNEVHYSEFVAAMLSTRIDLNDQLLDTAFRNFDKDLSGYITAENLREALGSSCVGSEKVEKLLREADFLEDGRISFPEFTAFVRGVPLEGQTYSAQLSYPAK